MIYFLIDTLQRVVDVAPEAAGTHTLRGATTLSSEQVASVPYAMNSNPHHTCSTHPLLVHIITLNAVKEEVLLESNGFS